MIFMGLRRTAFRFATLGLPIQKAVRDDSKTGLDEFGKEMIRVGVWAAVWGKKLKLK